MIRLVGPVPTGVLRSNRPTAGAFQNLSRVKNSPARTYAVGVAVLSTLHRGPRVAPSAATERRPGAVLHPAVSGASGGEPRALESDEDRYSAPVNQAMRFPFRILATSLDSRKPGLSIVVFAI